MGWFCVLRIGVSDLHHSSGQIGEDPSHAVTTADAGIAAINMSGTVLPAEHCPLGEYCQTADGAAAAVSGGGIRQDAVIESDVDTIMMAVKSHRFYFDGGVEEFRASDFGGSSIVQYRLGRGG